MPIRTARCVWSCDPRLFLLSGGGRSAVSSDFCIWEKNSGLNEVSRGAVSPACASAACVPACVFSAKIGCGWDTAVGWWSPSPSLPPSFSHTHTGCKVQCVWDKKGVSIRCTRCFHYISKAEVAAYVNKPLSLPCSGVKVLNWVENEEDYEETVKIRSSFLSCVCLAVMEMSS